MLLFREWKVLNATKNYFFISLVVFSLVGVF